MPTTRSKERTRKWRAKDPEARKKQAKEAMQRLRAKDPAKAREQTRKHARKVRLKKHGWTLEEFDKAWQAQNGRCAICTRVMVPDGSGSNSVAADHDHITGLARALLCIRCNSILGRFESLLRLVEQGFPFQEQFEAYLRKHSPWIHASLDRLARIKDI